MNIERSNGRCDGSFACPAAEHIEGCFTGEGHPDAIRQSREAIVFTAEEIHCLVCAMAGNFPKRFEPIRMDLLRKLAKASS